MTTAFRLYFLFLLTFSVSCFAQEIRVKWDPATTPFQDEVVKGIRYQRFQGLSTVRDELVGHPQIPRLQKWVAIDPAKKYSVKVEVLSEKMHAGKVLLYPGQADTWERRQPHFKINRASYDRDTWIGSEKVSMGKRSELGPITILPLEITPVQYHPKTGKMKVITDMKVTVSAVDGSKESFVRNPSLVTDFVRTQVASLVENPTEVLSSVKGRPTLKALIVTTDELLPEAKKLVTLQESFSITTKFETLKKGATPTEIKKLIQDRYNAEAMDAVLLFGGPAHLSLYEWDYNPGDVFYSLLKGDDNIADVALGRIPVKDEKDAAHLLEKTNRYMANLTAGKIRKNVMLIAHNEAYPGKYTANMEEVSKAPNPLGLQFTKQYGGEKANNDSVIKSFPNSFGIINYRGHGFNTGWLDWGSDDKSFTETEVNQLNNDDRDLALYFNIACDNGAIQGPERSLAEAQLFRPSNKPYEGAVAVIASTQPSYTETNHRFAKHLFASMNDNQSARLGAIYALANNKLVQEESGAMPENVKMYLLLGNPLLPMPYQAAE